MIPLVIEMDNNDCCHNMAQDFSEARFREHINRQTEMRNRKASHEAQERRRAAEKEKRVRDTRTARNWKCASRLAIAAVILFGAAIAQSAGHISPMLSFYINAASFVGVGWQLNNLVRSLRHDHRAAEKGGKYQRKG